MNKEEAIEAMKQGHKITHTLFTPEEWVTSDERGMEYTFEDGVTESSKSFWKDRPHEEWNDGYSIWQSPE